MAYGLHIEREDPIELVEWIATVTAHGERQLDEANSTAINPVTGAKIAVQGQNGTVAILVEGQWARVFHWNRGKISFKAPSSTFRDDPIMSAALLLASELAAFVSGDEGEIYDGSD